MKKDNADYHVMFASTVLLLFFVGLTFFAVSIVHASPASGGAGSGSTFKAKCAGCHGPDGGGSQVGKL